MRNWSFHTENNYIGEEGFLYFLKSNEIIKMKYFYASILLDIKNTIILSIKTFLNKWVENCLCKYRL